MPQSLHVSNVPCLNHKATGDTYTSVDRYVHVKITTAISANSSRADGQTGSGKTHTMMGQLGTDEEGIIPRLVANIFDGIQDANERTEFTV